MGFLEDAGEFFFGTETKKKAAANRDQATNRAAQIANDAQTKANAADASVAQSIGSNAGEYMQKANQSAQQNASQQAALAANQGARASLKAMKTGGLNPAAAAARAGQQAGSNYAGSYGQGVQQGVGQYMQGAQQFGNQASDFANRGAVGTDQQFGGADRQNAAADATYKNTMNIAQQAGAAALAISDERCKENIKPVDNERIKAILAKIKPVSYDYKDTANGKGEQVGVTAQNLEQAGLGGAVEESPDGTKMVNGAKMEMANLDMIKAMNDDIQQIKRILGGAK